MPPVHCMVLLKFVILELHKGQTAVATEEVFQKIGYLDSRGNRIACCDEEAYRVEIWVVYDDQRDKCKNVNSLLIPSGYEDQYKLEQTILRQDW